MCVRVCVCDTCVDVRQQSSELGFSLEVPEIGFKLPEALGAIWSGGQPGIVPVHRASASLLDRALSAVCLG